MNAFRKTLHLLNEMSPPQVIEPLNIDSNKKYVQNYWNENKSKFEQTDTEYLYKSGNNMDGYYMFVKNDVVYYYVKYKAKKDLYDHRLIRQVIVQRFSSDYSSVGIPKKTFFQYLLPTFGGIVTDTQQTDDGKRFWENAVYEALNNDSLYDVFVIDKRTNKPNRIKIKSHEHFSNITHEVWGISNVFRYMLIAIILK